MREILIQKNAATRVRSRSEDNSKRIIVAETEFCATYLSFRRFWQAKKRITLSNSGLRFGYRSAGERIHDESYGDLPPPRNRFIVTS